MTTLRDVQTVKPQVSGCAQGSDQPLLPGPDSPFCDTLDTRDFLRTSRPHPGGRLPGVRILILGASGLVGGVLWSELSQRHDVVGTCHSNRVPELVPLDLQDEKALAR